MQVTTASLFFRIELLKILFRLLNWVNTHFDSPPGRTFNVSLPSHPVMSSFSSENHLKATILLDRERPKVKFEDASRVLKDNGVKLVSKSPDIGIVIGGDGVFSDFGRSTSIPLLFVGVRTKKATGSKAFLAQTYFDKLPNALKAIKKGQFRIGKYRKVQVLKNNKRLGETFTDVYLERGAEGGCLRFKIRVRGQNSEFTDFSIGNGVIVSTREGSTGYYSYLDKLHNVDWLEPDRFTLIGV